MKFASPTNDIAFKKIFGDEQKSFILISFLNAILDFRGDRAIQSIKLANPYQVPKIEDLKNTILDIKATDNSANQFIVEMQVSKDRAFAKRSLYYTSKSYVNQITKGTEYRELKKVYFIGILDFSIFENQDYISQHLILDTKTFTQELKDFEFTFIELPKFTLALHECDSIAKKWIFFIQNADKFDLMPKEYEDIEAFKEAFFIASKFKWSQKELDVYDYIDIREGRKESELLTAYEDGLERGKEQGERNKAIEIAKKSLQKGLDAKSIALITELSIEGD